MYWAKGGQKVVIDHDGRVDIKVIGLMIIVRSEQFKKGMIL